MASYADGDELLKRKDWRTIGDLVSDSGTQVAEASLASDANVLQALEDASGDIDAALLVGGRYSTEDLEALTGNALAHLQRITCELAMYDLMCRRPDIDVERLEYYQKMRATFLEPLRTGQNVFNIVENIAAGKASVDGPTTLGFQDLNLVRDRTRHYYPPRFLPNNR